MLSDCKGPFIPVLEQFVKFLVPDAAPPPEPFFVAAPAIDGSN
tara:strand:- start:2366 stop:2494 length:129 start_codon:yes stop_codon:yes gene_type:complete